MASSFSFIILFSLLCISATIAKTPLLNPKPLILQVTETSKTQVKPKAVLLQVTKDPKTLQYVTQIKQRTPLVTLSLTVDLGGRYLFTNCESGYVSSTYQFPDCQSSQCKLARLDTFCNTCDGSIGPNCRNQSCADFAYNPYGSSRVAGSLASDVVSVQSTNGKNPTQVVSMPEFLFFCVDSKYGLLDGLPSGVTGIAAFGRTEISLSTQFARYFNYRKIFAICLSPKGIIFLGDGPYTFLPNVNAANSLTYTPLLVNRGSWVTQPSSDYYIGVTSIKINGQIVPINTTLLSFDDVGNGGTLISTVNAYSVLEPSIYDAFVEAFVKAMSTSVTRVAPVAPFEVCYDSKKIGTTRVGPAVPSIDLVLQSEDVYWRIFGANSMVQVNKDVLCLGFVKQGSFSPAPSITIGGYQLENNLLQFNVAKSTLGFSSSLLFQQTTCANFNFTSTAA